jgi:hypothetical protein
MKRLDQGHLHPLLEHPETNMSRPGIKPGPPGEYSSKELFEQLMSICCCVVIRNLFSINIYSVFPLYV